MFDINQEKKYEIKIDSKIVKIPISFFETFLNLEDEEYKLQINFLYYKEIPIKEFVYALIKYYNNNFLLEKQLSDKAKKRIQELEQMQIIDYEAIGTFQETIDYQLTNIKINKNLEEELDKIIETGKDTFHKFVLLYIELCKRFSYDYKYFLADKNSEEMHSDINYIEKINFSNSSIVCFEVISILAFYLKKLGLNYELLGKKEYGNHTILTFRYQEFLIKASPVETIFNNDLLNVKLGKPLKGLICINRNMNTKNNFEMTLKKYYQETKSNYYNGYLPCNKITYSINIPKDIKECLRLIDLAILKLKEQKLGVVEQMSYLVELINIYNFDTLNNNLGCEIIRVADSPFKFGVLIIINNSLYGNFYVLYDFLNIKMFSMEETQDLFDNKKFSDIRSKRYIRGIKR